MRHTFLDLPRAAVPGPLREAHIRNVQTAVGDQLLFRDSLGVGCCLARLVVRPVLFALGHCGTGRGVVFRGRGVIRR